MHRLYENTTLFYIRDLSVFVFWYAQGNQSHMDTERLYSILSTWLRGYWCMDTVVKGEYWFSIGLIVLHHLLA